MFKFILQLTEKIEIQHLKARSIDKSDVFLSVRDPRAGVERHHIGFSIKSEFGQNPTLFNTAPASAVIYKLTNMDDLRMDEINHICDTKGRAAVAERCNALLEYNCMPTYAGYPIAARAKCSAFAENLDLLDPRLKDIINQLLYRHFFLHDTAVNIPEVVKNLVVVNPLGITRPETKYPYVFKNFLYAAHCGLTASTLWDGKSDVNGGFIKVSKSGEVLAYYALESESFKNYLYNNCYLEFPATSKKHGYYGSVYKKADSYYFNLNFQIRYR